MRILEYLTIHTHAWMQACMHTHAECSIVVYTSQIVAAHNKHKLTSKNDLKVSFMLRRHTG